jgi:hypothetical protein
MRTYLYGAAVYTYCTENATGMRSPAPFFPSETERVDVELHFS